MEAISWWETRGDVYKRQGKEFMDIFRRMHVEEAEGTGAQDASDLPGGSSGPETAAASEEEAQPVTAPAEAFEAVSYTHLDVYKRQFMTLFIVPVLYDLLFRRDLKKVDVGDEKDLEEGELTLDEM